MNIQTITKAVRDGKTIFGIKTLLMNLRNSNLKYVVLSKNCPEKLSQEVNYLAKIANTKVESVDCNSDELGAKCKKPFLISILGIKE